MVNIKSKRVVYTALLGGYERLNEQPHAVSSEIDFICFTDDPELKSETWKIRLIKPRFPRDSIRSQRYLKMIGPELLNEYSESLYIDNSVLLKASAESLFKEWASFTDISLPLHSFRSSVVAEFDAVDVAGLDDPSRIHEQLITYSISHPSILEEKPFWTAIMFRRHTVEVFQTMHLWYENILRYSRRDQLSINYAIHVANLKCTALEIDNFNSEFHTWPIHNERNQNIRKFNLGDALRVPNAIIGRLENRLARLNGEILERNRQIAKLEFELNKTRIQAQNEDQSHS